MIAVDTSALMAIVLGEAEADACIDILSTESDAVLSAVTLAEALIVAGSRGVGEEMERLVEGLGIEIAVATPAGARRVAEAYGHWGRGSHPAGLNFGDCFSYEIARERSCPLLFIGNDFSKTDVESALKREV